MARTPSTMWLPLGAPAPAFTLPDAAGRAFSLAEVAGPKGTLVVFMCNHCPFVKHVAPELARLGRDLPALGIGMVGINPNDFAAYPDDAPAKMPAEAALWGWTFPYLVDADQSVARAWRAACTPDLFLLDGQGRLAYRGQLDASRPGNGVACDGRDLRAAAAALAEGREVPADQKPSLGCNVKWKPGAAPEWFG